MFQLTNRVGNMFCIYDSDDGDASWLNLNELKEALSKGISIVGINISNGSMIFKPLPISVKMDKANFDNGHNVFKSIKSMHVYNRHYNSANFIMTTAHGKKFKGNFGSNSTQCYINFHGVGISCELPYSLYHSWLESAKDLQSDCDD